MASSLHKGMTPSGRFTADGMFEMTIREGLRRKVKAMRRPEFLRWQLTFVLQILFAIVAIAALALVAPVDWQRYFENGSEEWRTKR